jgi:hypothetical protein
VAHALQMPSHYSPRSLGGIGRVERPLGSRGARRRPRRPDLEPLPRTRSTMGSTRAFSSGARQRTAVARCPAAELEYPGRR